MTPRPRTAGLTFVEVALIIALVGSLLAIFIPTFFRHLRTSKTAEAADQLRQLHLRSAAYFSTTHPLTDGTLGSACLPEGAGPAPAEPSQELREVDFADPETPGHATWDALGFQPEGPIRYRYTFAPDRAGCGQTASEDEAILVMRAEGDLDGDGILSTYERRATVSENAELIPTGVLHIRDRME